MWPLGGGDSAVRRNPADPAAPWPGKGAEGKRSSPWLGLGRSWGLEATGEVWRRSPAAAAAAGVVFPARRRLQRSNRW
jgi:hypothetical protein